MTFGLCDAGNGNDTDDLVQIEDVYGEVDGLMTQFRVGMHKMKPCTRKYAFELPDIPRETEYLKLLYPYDSMYHTLRRE